MRIARASLEALAVALMMSLTTGSWAQDTGTSAALKSYKRAKAILDAGVAAMGGAEALSSVRTIRRDFFDTWFDPTQAPRPWVPASPGDLPPPNAGFDRTQSQSYIDYAGNRWLEASKPMDSVKEYVNVLDAVTPENGFRSIHVMEEKKPYFDQFDAVDLPAQTTRRFRRHPEGLLRMALARPETLQWVDRAGTQEVISFADSLGTRIILYFDSNTHLLTKAETLRDHAVVGDTTTETAFSDYREIPVSQADSTRASSALKLPFRYLDRSAGVPTRLQDFANITINIALPEERFLPPAEFARIQHDPPTPQLEKISSSLYLMRGPYNVVFSVFPDYVVLYEAPMSDSYTRQLLAQVRSVAPDKPVRYAVGSHFHYDHIAGMRTIASEGITILTTPDAKEVIERAARVERTMRPDTLSRKPRQPVIEIVKGQRVLDEAGVRARLYDFGPTPHIGQLLAAYFPDEKVLYVADLMDVLTPELVIAGVDAMPMQRKIRELGLDVQRYIPVHGVPIEREKLEEGYRIRSKYVD